MTDVEQAFQLVVDFLRRKGFLAIATKLENSERVKIGKLNNAPTRLEALLLKGHAFEQTPNSWGNRENVQEENRDVPEPQKTGTINEDEPIPKLEKSEIKKVKSKAKQMGLSKSVNQTFFHENLAITPSLSSNRSDVPAMSMLSRADANQIIIGLPSRVTYRHSREPHTPLRAINKERRAASAIAPRKSGVPKSPPQPHSTKTRNFSVSDAVQKSKSVPATQYLQSDMHVTSEKIEEHVDEYSDDEDIGFTLTTTDKLPASQQTEGPQSRGPLEVYPNLTEDSDSDSTSKESESDTDDTIPEGPKVSDPSIFSMDLEDEAKSPRDTSKPVKKLSVSITGGRKKATTITQPVPKDTPAQKESSNQKDSPIPKDIPPLKEQSFNPLILKDAMRDIPPKETKKSARKKRTPRDKTSDNANEFTEVNIVSNHGDPKLEFFNLKIVYHQYHTGFEESRDFPIRLHDIVAGRYEITGYIGSAAFSRAVHCIDHKTGKTACMKIIKNNKDFFDQCLDELKLLKYIKANGDPHKFHVLEMYDYFYFKEHLFIVCELLLDNLYEFYKKNMQDPEEPHYFTLPRVQNVARQCLVALQYIHSLGLIHCDLKPENILMKNVERCEIKVIDFGSSCYTTDVLSTYVQSRSYRAPEVILGLPYGQKIDLWSLGCILAELLTGRVIFQNYSVVTLLARIIGIIGPIPEGMLQKGNFVNKYFTEEGDLYENTELITPKKTTLQRRVKSDDPLFLDFLKKLLTVDPIRRPTATEALQHPWLKKVYSEN